MQIGKSWPTPFELSEPLLLLAVSRRTDCPPNYANALRCVGSRPLDGDRVLPWSGDS
jgi:hypothetical protein